MDDRFGAFVPGGRYRVPPTAPGLLSGLTFAVKDLIDVAGRATGGGNPEWLATHGPAAAPAPAVAMLLGAGATLVGSCVTDELAFSLEGANAHYGTPVNPAAPDRLPGGSSSGSAVAVAARQADFALGTDTGGSVRFPAAFCGLFGFRPSHGAVSTEGVIAFAPSFDTVGWLARDAATLARVGDALLPPAESTPLTRLLIGSDAFGMADGDVADAVRTVIAPWPVTGEVSLHGGAAGDLFEAFRVLQGVEIWRSLGSWITATRPRFGASIAERYAGAAALDPAETHRWEPFRAAFRLNMARAIPSGTAIIVPTTPTLPPSRDTDPAALGDFYVRSLTMNAVAGLAGLPQVTMPLASAGGVPVGISLIAARGADRALLHLAGMLSAGKGISRERPL
ncbi:MAG: amidase [Bauldia sp.]|nr:amidase [Bauldia sp.]